MWVSMSGTRGLGRMVRMEEMGGRVEGRDSDEDVGGSEKRSAGHTREAPPKARRARK